MFTSSIDTTSTVQSKSRNSKSKHKREKKRIRSDSQVSDTSAKSLHKETKATVKNNGKSRVLKFSWFICCSYLFFSKYLRNQNNVINDVFQMKTFSVILLVQKMICLAPRVHLVRKEEGIVVELVCLMMLKKRIMIRLLLR